MKSNYIFLAQPIHLVFLNSIAALLVFLLLTTNAYSAVVNQAVVQDANANNGQQIVTSPNTAIATAEYGRPDTTSVGSLVKNNAIASPGSVGVRSEVSGRGDSGRALARTTGTFMILGPGTQVSGGLNLDVNGELGLSVGENSPSAGASLLLTWVFGPGTSSNARVALSASSGGINQRLTFSGFNGSLFDGSQTTNGASSWDFTFATPNFQLPLNTLLTLSLSAEATAALGSTENPDEFAGAAALFGDTFKLHAGGPVFNLPNGYTVVSEDFGIKNNLITPTSPVPLPLPLWLFISGLTLVFSISKRKKQNFSSTMSV